MSLQRLSSAWLKAYRGSSVDTAPPSVHAPTNGSANDNYVLPQHPQQAPAQVQNPATWDYKTSPIGLNGQSLPPLATGWKPDGTPYFGDGPLGYVKGMVGNSAQAWKDGYNRGLIWDKQAGTSFQAPLVATVENFKTAVSETLFGALNVLGAFSYYTGRLGGTVGYTLQDLSQGKTPDVNLNWESSRLTYNAVVNAWKPELETLTILKDKSLDFMSGGNKDVRKALDFAFKVIPGPQQIGYLAAQVIQQDGVLHSLMNGDQIRQEFLVRMNKGEHPDNIATDIQMRGGANAWIETLGQVAFDPLNADMFLAKTPRQIQTALQVTKQIGTAESPIAAEFLASGAQQIVRTGDQLAAGDKLAEVTKSIVETAQKSSEMMQTLEKPGVLKQFTTAISELPSRVRSISKFIQESKNLLYVNTSGAIVDNIATTLGPEGSIEAIQWMRDLHSVDAKVARDAADSILKLPNANVLLSPMGNDFGAILDHMLNKWGKTWMDDIRLASSEGGSVQTAAMMMQKVKGTLNDLFPSAIDVVAAMDKEKQLGVAAKLSDNVKYAEDTLKAAQDALSATTDVKAIKKAEQVVKKAAEALDKTKLATENATRWAKLGERMSSAEINIARAHNFLQQGIVGKINHAFSYVYMGTSPAFGIRNVLNNDFTMFLDHGAGVFAKTGDEFISIAEKWYQTTIPVAGYENANRAIDTATEVIAATDAEKTTAWEAIKASFFDASGKFSFDVRRGSGVAEKGGAKAIVGSTYIKTFQDAIEPMFKSLKADKKFVSVSETEWNLLRHEFNANYGNVDNTLRALENIRSTGIVDTFKYIDNIPQGLLAALDAPTKEQIASRVLNAATKEEAQAALDSIFKGIENKAATAALAPVKMTPGDKLHDVLATLIKMGGEQPAESKLIASQRQIFRDAWNRAHEVVSGAETLARQAGVQENVLKAIKDKNLVSWGADAVNKNDTLLDITNIGVTMAKQDTAKMQDIWGLLKKAPNKLPAEMPTSLKEFANAVWTNYKSMRAENWALDTEGGLAKVPSYLSDLSKEMAKTGIQLPESMLSKANDALEYAKTAQNISVADFGVMIKDPLPMLYGTKGSQAVTLAIKRYGLQIGDQFAQQERVLNIVNQYTHVKFSSLEDVSFELIDRALASKAKKVNATIDELTKMIGGKPLSQSKIDELKQGDLANYISVYGEPPSATPLAQDLTPAKINRFPVPSDVQQAWDASKQASKAVDDIRAQKDTLGNGYMAAIEAAKTVKNKADAILNDVMGKNGFTQQMLNQVQKETVAAQKLVQKEADKAAFFAKYGDVTKKEAQVIDRLDTLAADAPAGYKYEPQVKPFAPPVQEGLRPTVAQALAQGNNDQVLAELAKYVDQNFGKTSLVTSTADQKILKDLAFEMNSKTSTIRSVSLGMAQENRNFTLLNYGMKTYGDVASAYLLPYGFWYKGTYANWAKRAVYNPEILAGYAKYKNAMAIQNAGLPDWWKQNIKVGSLFGIPLDNPFYFNLEATLWPLNGITGEDFSDPNKTVNWWSYTIDQIGKFGPSTWTPINMVTGLVLRAQGQQEASDRWLGRVIPQTALIKALTNVELDPVVGLMQNGLDPYERKRVGRALADMVTSGIVSQVQAIDAANSQSGPLWDAAIKNSNANRALGQTMSTMFGVGFKARTQSDMQIDQFDVEYGKVFALYKGGFTDKVTFRQQMALLGEKYPFMDTVLISRRGGPERDTALAYNALSRIPPGDATALMKFVGIDNATVNRFYNDGGDTSKWTIADQTMFNGAILQLAATFQMPNLPTKQEWNTTKTQYDEMRTAIAQQLGSDIWTKVDTYYEAKDAGRGADFLALNPDVQQAFNLKDAYTVNNPKLSTYYGGIDTIQRYYEGQAKAVLVKKYGQDIYQFSSQYYSANSTEEKKQIMAAHPQLKPFMAEKALWTKWVVDATVKMGSKLQDKPALELRPATSSTIQKSLGAFQNQRKPTADEWKQTLGIPMFNLIADTLRGKPLTYTVQNNLDFEAQKLGYYNGDALLTDVLVSIQKP